MTFVAINSLSLYSEVSKVFLCLSCPVICTEETGVSASIEILQRINDNMRYNNKGRKSSSN